MAYISRWDFFYFFNFLYKFFKERTAGKMKSPVLFSLQSIFLFFTLLWLSNLNFLFFKISKYLSFTLGFSKLYRLYLISIVLIFSSFINLFLPYAFNTKKYFIFEVIFYLFFTISMLLFTISTFYYFISIKKLRF